MILNALRYAKLQIVFCIFAISAQATDVVFPFINSQRLPQGTRSMELIPLSPPLISGGAVVTRDRIPKTTGADGTVTYTNLVGGTNVLYRAEFHGSWGVTTNWYQFPETNAVLSGADLRWIITPTNAPAAFAYSMTAADARFASLAALAAASNSAIARLNGSGTNPMLYGATLKGSPGSPIFTAQRSNGVSALQMQPGGEVVGFSSNNTPTLLFDPNSGAIVGNRAQVSAISLQGTGGISSGTNAFFPSYAPEVVQTVLYGSSITWCNHLADTYLQTAYISGGGAQGDDLVLFNNGYFGLVWDPGDLNNHTLSITNGAGVEIGWMQDPPDFPFPAYVTTNGALSDLRLSFGTNNVLTSGFTFLGPLTGNGAGLTNLPTARVMTNVTLSTGNATATFSNSVSGVWPGLIFDAKTNTYLHIDFTATGQAGPGTNVGASINYWPQHNYTRPNIASEFVLTADGSLAFGAKWFQWSVKAWQPTFHENFGQYVNSANTNLQDSLPILFRASYWSNGVERMSGSGMGATSNGVNLAGVSMTQYEAAFHYRAIDNLGRGSFGFYNAFNNDDHSGTFDTGPLIPQHEFIIGPTNPGLKVTGFIQVNGLSGITTNQIIGNTVWQINSGLITSIAAIDSDLVNYLGRVGTLSTATTNAAAITNGMITFVATLKATGIWTNCDFLYVPLGTNATACAQNLITNYFNGAPSGGFTTADATGLKSDGTGYIDTTWRGTNSVNSCGVFVYLASDSSTYGTKTAIGADNGSSYIWIGYANSAFWYSSVNCACGGIVLTTPSFPTSMLILRTSATTEAGYVNGVANGGLPTGETGISAPAYNVFVCARNHSGTATDVFNGKIQMAAGFRTALSASQAAALHSACAALNTALGR